MPPGGLPPTATKKVHGMNRRDFVRASTLALTAASAPAVLAQSLRQPGSAPAAASAGKSRAFWPNGARLAVSVTMQFEGGGQPISGAPGPITVPIDPGVPDLTQNTYYEYGPNEGIPRLLNLFDRHAIKVTSFMIGEAVDKRPDLAREIVRRGHEAANHGKRWAFQYRLPAGEE